jgi:flagellar hook-associated protein 3 FlgL
MRISDAMMSSNYLKDLSSAREKLANIQKQMSSQKKIQQPSDSPAGTARVMDLQVKMSQAGVYQKNIDSGITFIKESITSLGEIDTSIATVLQTIKDSKNAVLSNSNLVGLSEKIDSVLSAIMDQANSQYDGKFLFGGTDNATAPFGYTTDQTAIEVKANDITGNQNIRISDNRIQNINIPGSDIFSTIVTQAGNLNSAAAVGAVSTSSTQVYDSGGTAYTLNVSYQKTAANTYNMTYDILDGGGTTVLAAPPAAKAFAFDSATGMLKTIDGNAPGPTSIKVPGSKIEFLLDSTQLQETNAASSVSNSANQKTNIFNTLISIRDNLKNGVKPTAEQESQVQAFFDNLVNKESQIGNIQTQMENVQELLKQKTTNFQELIAGEMEVDMPKLLIDLQNQEYVLEMSYKMASMILPKSLMDYL